ncbi:MAG: phosphate ABC transporter permease subunit PstC [Lentisphaerae bacterium]|nr:phosphate ABC transporter permease subunit PstC [Lentisphaerota bacterium]
MPTREHILLTTREMRKRRVFGLLGRSFLLLVTSVAALAVLAIIFFIARDALPFFRISEASDFFFSKAWYPTHQPPQFGAAAIFVGSLLVTAAAVVLAVPPGVCAALCMSDILPFNVRQVLKPVIEMLAAIPSVAYGFFALVVLAPLLQNHGGRLLATAWWVLALPTLGLGSVVAADLLTPVRLTARAHGVMRSVLTLALLALSLVILITVSRILGAVQIASGVNALNASVILGVMALPTIVSVSEDALQAAGRELREGSYALGATRAETLVKVVIPASISGIFSAVLLGIMRALGETMVVWMASGNAAQIPKPWYNLLLPVRTLTATIAGDMGEADQMTGSAHYHVLFAMGLSLLVFSFACNLAGEWIVTRQRKRLRGC